VELQAASVGPLRDGVEEPLKPRAGSSHEAGVVGVLEEGQQKLAAFGQAKPRRKCHSYTRVLACA